ncbi:MAG: acylneuraminate cytidylyltransferase family protein [Limisphaerales bacterium]
MRILGIIPARGGSKGVPRKNVRMLGGKPLICHSIDAAKGCKSVSHFLVSTDDPEITQIATSWGAEVLPRPAELAQDATPMPKVIHHVLRERGTGFDIILLLQPTCPQRTPEDIDAALAAFENLQVQSVMSVYQVEDHHPGRMYQLESGRLAPLFPEWIAARRQDLPAIYHRNGAIYACRVDHFKRTGFLWDERPVPYVMPRNRSLNIDDPFDFEIAEFIYSRPQT